MDIDIVRRAAHKFRVNINAPGRVVGKLRREDDSALKSVGNVLDAIMRKSFSSEENDWIEKIETLRKRLCASSTEIAIRRYGVGRRDPKLAAEEIHRGRVVIRSIGKTCRLSSLPYKWSCLLFKLVREFSPSVCLELGTSLGLSGAYQAAALESNQRGQFVTLEGAESLASLAKANFEELGLTRCNIIVGRFQDTLEEVLHDNAPIDFVFIDGHHEEHATITYVRQMVPHLSDGAILVFDDIHWSRGMDRAWNTMRIGENIKISLDMYRMGVCIFAKSGIDRSRHFRLGI